MRVKVFLHGYLKDFHDGPIEVNANTVAEAITWVTRSLPGFKPNAVRGRHRVRAAGCDTVEALYLPPTNGEVHLVPQFVGGKQGGFLQVLLGAALIAVSFLIPGAGFLLQAGALMFLGGVASFLMPTPESDTSQDETQKSRYLGAPKNTVEIGTRIPILYGEHQVYGHYISFDIDAVETTDET